MAIWHILSWNKNVCGVKSSEAWALCLLWGYCKAVNLRRLPASRGKLEQAKSYKSAWQCCRNTCWCQVHSGWYSRHTRESRGGWRWFQSKVALQLSWKRRVRSWSRVSLDIFNFLHAKLKQGKLNGKFTLRSWLKLRIMSSSSLISSEPC